MQEKERHFQSLLWTDHMRDMEFMYKEISSIFSNKNVFRSVMMKTLIIMKYKDKKKKESRQIYHFFSLTLQNDRGDDSAHNV